MAVESVITGPNPVTLGVTLFDYVTGIKDSSRIESAQIAAARDAGYSGTRAQLVAIGQGLLSQAAFSLGQGAGPGAFDRAGPGGPLYSAAPLPAPTVPGTGGSVFDELLRRPVGGGTGKYLLEDLLRRPVGSGAGKEILDDLLRRPVGSGRAGYAVAAAGSLAAILARASGLLAVLYPRPAGAGSDRRDEFPNDAPNPVTDAVKGPPRRGGPRTRTRRPRRRLPVLPGTLPRPQVPSVEPARPRSEPRPYLPPIEASEPQPVSAPQPLPAPSPTAAPLRIRLPSIASLAVPLALAAPLFLSSPRGNRARPLSGRVPGTTIDRINRIREPIGLTAFQPGALSSPLTSSSSGDENCKCTKPTKRKKPRKARSVCYRGTYIERANGLTKLKREKIPCR